MPHTWDLLLRFGLSWPYRAVWRALCWLRRPHIYTGDRVVLTRTLFGHWIYVDALDCNVAPSLLIRGYWEPNVTRLLLSELRPGMRYVEVGANLGYYTLLAASRIGEQGRVFAFEANPRLADLAHRSLFINGLKGVEVHAKAVSDRSGTATLHIPTYGLGGASLYSGHHPYEETYEAKPPEALEVPCVTLDESFADDPEPIDILRIDAEGSEPSILAGAKELLARSPNIKIIMEYSPTLIRRGGHDPEELLHALREEGFRIQGIGPRGPIPFETRETGSPEERPIDLLLTRGA